MIVLGGEGGKKRVTEPTPLRARNTFYLWFIYTKTYTYTKTAIEPDNFSTPTSAPNGTTRCYPLETSVFPHYQRTTEKKNCGTEIILTLFTLCLRVWRYSSDG